MSAVDKGLEVLIAVLPTRKHWTSAKGMTDLGPIRSLRLQGRLPSKSGETRGSLRQKRSSASLEQILLEP